jgi:hypothetical protein
VLLVCAIDDIPELMLVPRPPTPPDVGAGVGAGACRPPFFFLPVLAEERCVAILGEAFLTEEEEDLAGREGCGWWWWGWG